jgi:hypothetical protein
MRTRLPCRFLLAIAVFALALPSVGAIGQTANSKAATSKAKKPAPRRPAGKGGPRKAAARNTSEAKSRRDAPITAEMKSEITSFVREHHRELVDVLAHLKANVPKEYERAMRELSRQWWPRPSN